MQCHQCRTRRSAFLVFASAQPNADAVDGVEGERQPHHDDFDAYRHG